MYAWLPKCNIETENRQPTGLACNHVADFTEVVFKSVVYGRSVPTRLRVDGYGNCQNCGHQTGQGQAANHQRSLGQKVDFYIVEIQPAQPKTP